MLKFLNKPFPGLGYSNKSILNNFLIGCFIAAFLIVFQPFGISEWQTPYKTLKLLGFGFVSFIAPVIVNFCIYFVLPKKIIEDNWTILKEILAIVVVLLFISMGNMIYGRILNIFPISLNGFIGAFISTLILGIFPVTFHVLMKHNKLLKINVQKANMINEQLHSVIQKSINVPIELDSPIEATHEHKQKKDLNSELCFIAENEKDEFKIEPVHLMYIESADNYSNIIYLNNDKLKKQLLRASLKRLESQLNTDYILRCHRTYIVNLKNVKSVEGNAAGYKLKFSDDSLIVPVSRNYGPIILEKLGDLK